MDNKISQARSGGDYINTMIFINSLNECVFISA